ncbi:unnamed protein product [Symbiodinium microadriaticum]|nr:unnamed protein product [Symbiodinium sp. KB8]CAE7237388.1 unnamed protein product [Symbiodinium microadriaticum]
MYQLRYVGWQAKKDEIPLSQRDSAPIQLMNHLSLFQKTASGNGQNLSTAATEFGGNRGAQRRTQLAPRRAENGPKSLVPVSCHLHHAIITFVKMQASEDPDRDKVIAQLGPRWQAMCKTNASTTFLWSITGKKKCGWVQLLPRGKLSTTWCLGSWEVLANNTDVIDMSFSDYRHLCHYKDGGFVVEQKYGLRTGKDAYKPGVAKTEGYITKNDQRGHSGVPGYKSSAGRGSKRKDLSDDEAEAKAASFLQKDLSFEAFFGAWSDWKSKRERCFSEVPWATAAPEVPMPEETKAEAALREAEEAEEAAEAAALQATEATAEACVRISYNGTVASSSTAEEEKEQEQGLTGLCIIRRQKHFFAQKGVRAKTLCWLRHIKREEASPEWIGDSTVRFCPEELQNALMIVISVTSVGLRQKIPIAAVVVSWREPVSAMAQDAPAAAAEAPPDRPIASMPELTSQAEWPWRKVESAESVEEKEAPAEVPEDKSLRFRRDLWDKFDFLWRERIEPSQGLLQKVADLLRSRAELERKYGESLLGFGGDLQVEPGNPLHTAVDAMIVNFRNRGEQSITLADELEQDIIVCFDTVIKQHKEVSRKIHSDVQLVTKYAQERRKAHDKLARRYGSRCAEAEYLAQDCLQAVSMKTADRLKLAQQATVLSKQARLAEYEYYQSIEQADGPVVPAECSLCLVTGQLPATSRS